MFIGLFLTAMSATVFSGELSIVQRGTWGTVGCAHAAAKESLLFRAEGMAGLSILELSQDGSSAEIARFDTGGYAYHVFLADRYAFVSDRDIGMIVLDIRNPQKPRFVKSVPIPVNLSGYRHQGLFVRGRYLYVLESNTGLSIIDLQNDKVDCMVEMEEGSWGGFGGLFLHENLMLVGVYHSVWFFDVTVPNVPVKLAEVSFESSVETVHIHENHAYVSSYRDKSIHILNVSHPEAPTEVGQISFSGHVLDIKTRDDTLFAGIRTNQGLAIVDISDPANSIQIGDLPYPQSSYRNLALAAEFAVIDGSGVVDISDLTMPFLAGQVMGSGVANAVDVIDNTAYVATESGMFVLDVSHPGEPTLLHVFPKRRVTDVMVQGPYAYATDGNSLWVFDIKTNTEMGSVIVGYPSSVSKYSLFVDGNYAYVAAYEGLRIVDVSNPATPEVVAWLNDLSTGSLSGMGDHRGLDIAVTYPYAHLAGYAQGLVIVDVSDPNNPAPVSACCTGQAVTLSDGIAYLHGSDGLRIVDVSQPNFPRVLSHHPTGGYSARGLTDVAISDQVLFIADADKGLTAIDVFHPKNPFTIGLHDTLGDARGVAFRDGRAYVADGYTGRLVIFDIERAPFTQFIPWVPSNQQFESRLSLFNHGPDPTSISLCAIDQTGETMEQTLQVDGQSVAGFDGQELFSGFSDYALFSSADNPFQASILTFNLEASSGGHSPAQTSAASTADLSSGLFLSFGNINVGDTAMLYLAAPEKGPQENTQVNIQLTFADSANSFSQTLHGNRPLPVDITQQIFDSGYALKITAQADDQETRIVGLGLLLNTAHQMSMTMAFPRTTQGEPIK